MVRKKCVCVCVCVSVCVCVCVSVCVCVCVHIHHNVYVHIHTLCGRKGECMEGIHVICMRIRSSWLLLHYLSSMCVASSGICKGDFVSMTVLGFTN